MAGEVDATCTNALNKEAMNKALEYYHGEKSDGYTHFDGHTEIYATYTHTKKYTMMLAHHDLRVVHVSTHVSLREACDRVKKERVLEVIEIANKACKDMGIENPRIAVAGLNPHCGENGLFGEFLTNAQGEDVVAGVAYAHAHFRDERQIPGSFCPV